MSNFSCKDWAFGDLVNGKRDDQQQMFLLWVVKSDGCSIKELEKRKRKLKQANRERELKKRRIMKDKLHAFKMLHRGRFSSIYIDATS